MKKHIILSIIFFFAFGMVFGQQDTDKTKFSTYAEMRKQFGDLYQKQKFKEAAELLENHLNRFPDHIPANSFNLALTYGNLKEYEKGIKALKYALDRGVWFSIYTFLQDMWAPYKELEMFNEILTMNEELRQEAQKKTKPELIVVTPENYSKEKKYPLFIALHGGGENIEYFRNVWKSEKMENEFITAYPQSSYVASMDGYTWTQNLELAEKEIKDAYNKIIEDYPIDKEKVIVGGFSSGGIAALEIVMKNTFPVTGFISLCPDKRGSFTLENIKKAVKRGIRGTILTTEMDPRVEQQKEMVEMLKNEKFPYKFIITPDIGHWIPADLNVKIDKAIDHIREK